jgi:DNA repair protein RecO (recombination protein O)
MPILRDFAVVLMRYDYSETSQVLAFFTRGHGKVRAIGKGTKRGTKTRFAVGIDLLEMGELSFSSRQEHPGLATLTEWKQTRSLSGLREKLSRLQAAEYAAEITAALTEDWDPHTELFDALSSTLMAVNDAAEPLGPIVAYQWDLLESIGLLPRFEACVLCGRETDLTHFSSLEGGMICKHCEPGQVEKRQVSKATALALREMEPSRSAPGCFTLLNYHLSHLMGREPRLGSKLVPRARQRLVE